VEAAGPRRAGLARPYSSDDPEDGKEYAEGDEAKLSLHRADHCAAKDDSIRHDVAREMHGILPIDRPSCALERPNFARPHKTLSITGEDGQTIKRTPAMAAGVADHIWTAAEIVELLD
jgi:hypothetical protein